MIRRLILSGFLLGMLTCLGWAGPQEKAKDTKPPTSTGTVSGAAPVRTPQFLPGSRPPSALPPLLSPRPWRVYELPPAFYYYGSPYGYTPYGLPPWVVYQPVYSPTFVNAPPAEAFPRPPAPQPTPPPMVKEPPPRPAPRVKEEKAKDDLEMRADAQRLIRQGNEAFAEGSYLLAGRRYDQAATAAPMDPTAYFHLAQAQCAQGKYRDAILAIQRGMRMQPTWPLTAFQPRALYRDRAGEYVQHLAQLAEAVGKNLNDDSLLFLLGYQLWFDDRRDEALVLFQRAALLAFDTTFIDRFLRAAKPGVPFAER